MATILETMRNFFTEDQWNYTEVDHRPILRMDFQGKNGNWTCYAQAEEEKRYFCFYSVCPINVPENKRLLLAEYITRANYGLYIGNFEMDFRDGEIRYKTSIDVEKELLTNNLIHNLTYANVFTMDRYFPGVMAVYYGNSTPEVAISDIEG